MESFVVDVFIKVTDVEGRSHGYFVEYIERLLDRRHVHVRLETEIHVC